MATLWHDEEDESLNHAFVSKTIEHAQEKVEKHNFDNA